MSYKILITGANGLVGKALRSCLLKYNYNVIASGLGNDRFSILGGVYEELDTTSLDSCEIIINRYRPDVIINAAALTSVDECEENKKSCIKINTNSVLNFIPLVEKYGIHFIQLSSDFVFSGEKGSYNEGDVCAPVNYYGSSKLETEILLLKKLSNFTVLRTSLVYSGDNSRSNFLYWVKSSLEKKIELASIAKGQKRNEGNETFYLKGNKKIKFKTNDKTLFFLQRLRDEAHRFAITSHKTRR